MYVYIIYIYIHIYTLRYTPLYSNSSTSTCTQLSVLTHTYTSRHVSKANLSHKYVYLSHKYKENTFIDSVIIKNVEHRRDERAYIRMYTRVNLK